MYVGAIVLAGGRSRRMGRPKEALPFLGTSLLGRVVETLLLCTHPVVVVARDLDQDLPPLPLESEVTFDPKPDQGPLVGLAAGLRAVSSRCDAALVCGCDMPFIDSNVVQWLVARIQEYDIVVPTVAGQVQPLAGLYRPRILAEADKLLAAGARAPKDLFAKVKTRVLPEAELSSLPGGGRVLSSVNSPEEYQAALRSAQPQAPTER